MNRTDKLTEKIQAKQAKIGIIGLGYVGLPLVIEFVKSGFHVTGFDVDLQKIKSLQAGSSYISYIQPRQIKEIYKTKRFIPTTDFLKLNRMDIIIVCVPTPLTQQKEPDMSYVFNTTRMIKKHLRPGQLVVLESTTYPGTTDQDMRRILEESGLKAGKDFYLAFSPERIDPGRQDYSTSTTPKLIGGYTPDCLKIADCLYRHVVKKTVLVSSPRVAEAAKLLENIYRAVNVALVNELKMLFNKMDIDIWEVIEAAKTKPFGFQAFYPGPGLGGHCIPIDPFYLTWKAREYDFHTRFIELAGEINTHMPFYIINKVTEALRTHKKDIKGARILVLGLAYKKDVDDTRESPSLYLIKLLQEKGAHVDYNDPHVPKMKKMREYDFNMKSIPLTEANLKKYTCVLIATNHTDYDYGFIVKHSRIIVDTRNATGGIKSPKVVKA